MSEIEREIASQPDCWRRAETLAADSVLVLPHAGERVVALGCGTSWFIAQAYAARRAELHMGLGVTDAFTPTELPVNRPIDRTIVISRSGTTTEAIRAIERMREEADAHHRDHRGRRLPRRRPRGPHRRAGLRRRAVGRADAVRDERARVPARPPRRGPRARRSPTPSEPLAMPLPARPDGVRPLRLPGRTAGASGSRTRRRSSCARRPRPTPRATPRWSTATARSASRARPAWSGSSAPPTRASPTTSRATGATVRIGELDPMAELVLIHRTAVALAEARGLDPDHPRHLTRSVVLHEEGTT